MQCAYSTFHLTSLDKTPELELVSACLLELFCLKGLKL